MAAGDVAPRIPMRNPLPPPPLSPIGFIRPRVPGLFNCMLIRAAPPELRAYN